MCVSLVFAVNVAEDRMEGFKHRAAELGGLYGYGIGFGHENLLSGAKSAIIRVLGNPEVVFEVHDVPEPHCACDIDDDIRIASKTGTKSRFFDFVREIIEHEGLRALTVLFFQEELPGDTNVRKQMGTFEDFIRLLNRWNTWQVEGFEPTRRSFYIADDTPLLFTFTDRKFSQ
ncbi:MAG: hypothetical protein ACYC21_00270 [Eubacteriales bacterium]